MFSNFFTKNFKFQKTNLLKQNIVKILLSFYSWISFYCVLPDQQEPDRPKRVLLQLPSCFPEEVWSAVHTLYYRTHVRSVQWSGDNRSATTWNKYQAPQFRCNWLHNLCLQGLWRWWWRKVWKELALLDWLVKLN